MVFYKRLCRSFFMNFDDILQECMKDVKVYPDSLRQNMDAQLNRKYWCISRQRVWGVPIPVFYHRDTGEVLINRYTLNVWHYSSLVSYIFSFSVFTLWFDHIYEFRFYYFFLFLIKRDFQSCSWSDIKTWLGLLVEHDYRGTASSRNSLKGKSL